MRELENCIRRTATLARGERIGDDDFACRHDECLSSTLWKTAVSSPFPIIQPRARDTANPYRAPVPPAIPLARDMPPSNQGHDPFVASAADHDPANYQHDNVKVSRQDLVAALEATGWVQAKAARMLRLTPRQIGYALRKYGIEVRRL